MEDVAQMRQVGEREGREDAERTDWADWHDSTMRVWGRPSRRVTQAEADAYLAAYEQGMQARLRELATEREGVQS